MKSKPTVTKILSERDIKLDVGNDVERVISALQRQVTQAKNRGFTRVDLIVEDNCGDVTFVLMGHRPETEIETARRVKREAKEKLRQKKFEIAQTRENAKEKIVETILAAGLTYEDVQQTWKDAMQSLDG
jgi:dephospho-CoA kinase